LDDAPIKNIHELPGIQRLCVFRTFPALRIMIICVGTLNYMQGMLSNDYEICGNLFVKQNKCLTQEHIVVGKPNECTFSGLSWVIFHTHPLVAKSYPSIQDVIKVVKHDVIQYSIIFTEFGIWNISSGRKMSSKSDKEKVKQNLIDKYTTSYLDHDIYKMDASKKLDIDVINEYIERMKHLFKSFELHIQFDVWADGNYKVN
jgi:hypothetical protein